MTKVSIGTQLKKTRAKKEVTLSEVYQQTRIHPDVLSALEDDRYDSILNPIYIKSFLKRYANYLGLDSEKILQEYRNIREKEKPGRGRGPDSDPSEYKQKTPPQGQRLKINLDSERIIKIAKPVSIFVGIILAILIFIKGATFLVNKASQKAAQLTKELKEKRQEGIKEAKVVKKEEPKKPTVKEAAPKPVPVKKEEAATAAAASTKTQAPEEKKDALLAPKSAPLSIPARETLKLTIRATNDAWIQLKVDGKIIFQNVLPKDSTETWQAKENFEIWTGRAEALYLNLNGNDLGVLDRGVKRGVIIDRRGIRR